MAPGKQKRQIEDAKDPAEAFVDGEDGENYFDRGCEPKD
jgi:hypothetical protein